MFCTFLSCNQHDPHHSVCTWRLLKRVCCQHIESSLCKSLNRQGKGQRQRRTRGQTNPNPQPRQPPRPRSEWCLGSKNNWYWNTSEYSSWLLPWLLQRILISSYIVTCTLQIDCKLCWSKNKTWQVQLFKPFTQKREVFLRCLPVSLFNCQSN